MTILAEIRDFLCDEFGVPASMGGMTNNAIFLDWRMFKNKWATLIGMALITELIYTFCFQHALGQ